MEKYYPLLAFDTSSSRGYVALALRPDSVFSACTEGELSHSEELESLTKQVLAQAGISIREIACLIVGQGPGSFTGLRIGYSFVKGLSIGTGAPLMSFSSLRACAVGLEGSRVVALDARRGECFAGFYEGLPQALQIQYEDRLTTVADLAADLSKNSAEKAIKIVSDLDDLRSVEGVIPIESPNLAEGLLSLVINSVNSASWDRYQELWNLVTLMDMTPHYVRAVAAKTIKERQSELRSEA